MSADPTAADESLPAPIAAFVDATNRGDTDAFIAAFADDAFLSDWGREFRGHDGVASWDRTDNIGKRSHFEVVRWHRDGGDVVVELTVTGDGYNGTGPMTFTLDRSGARIQSLVIAPAD